MKRQSRLSNLSEINCIGKVLFDVTLQKPEYSYWHHLEIRPRFASWNERNDGVKMMSLTNNINIAIHKTYMSVRCYSFQEF